MHFALITWAIGGDLEWCLAAAAAEIWMAGAALMQKERAVVGTMNDGCSISHCHLRSDSYTMLAMT